MKRDWLRRGYHLLWTLGLDPRRTVRTSRNLGWFVRDLALYWSRAGAENSEFPFGRLYPCLEDKGAQSGEASGHYFHQDLLVARRIFASRPERHIDVGSRLDGFVAHVASFRRIEVLDVRPLTSSIPNVVFRQRDLMALEGQCDDVADSVSCLHALEHFGLGRYADPIDPDGHLKGLAGLHALVKPGGILYLSVPIGPQRIEFNAHRVFALSHLLDLVRDRFQVEAFSYVDDCGELHENVPLEPSRVAVNYGCTYGCGVLELRRI